MSRSGSEDGFLGRWSRRKRHAVRAEDQEEATAEPNHGAPPEAPLSEAEPETDEAILARLDLPDPDTLEAGDDFSRYLRAPLPQHLKQRALRRLWRSNPVLANLDGLNDYDTDFTGDTVPLGTLKTAYEVGRGFAARALEPDAVTEGGEELADTDVTGAETAAEEPSELVDTPLPDAEPVADETDPPEARTRRRMAFRFDEQD